MGDGFTAKALAYAHGQNIHAVDLLGPVCRRPNAAIEQFGLPWPQNA